MIFQNEKTPFQAIKTGTSKIRKKDIFQKGLVHAFGLNMAIFAPFFYEIQAKKMYFMIFYNEKTPFQTIKTGTSKSRKMDIFPKGLVNSSGPKLAIFPPFFLDNTGQENVFYDILKRKNDFLSNKNVKFKKSKNGQFSKKGQSTVLVQNWSFFQLFFQAIYARKMCFIIFQNGKTPFQAIKTRSSKSRKMDILPKGLVHSLV